MCSNFDVSVSICFVTRKGLKKEINFKLQCPVITRIALLKNIKIDISST